MFLAFILLLVITFGGVLLTYVYDDDAPFAARLCMGAVVGQTLFGLLGFWLAVMFGLNLATLSIATLVTASAFLLLVHKRYKKNFLSDWARTKRGLKRALLQPTFAQGGYFIFYFSVALMLWLFFDRAMIVNREGIFTGAPNNLGDLPFHLGVINSFVFGQNFPPEHLAYSGTRFTYPFVSDFIAAMLVRAGASVQDALWLQSMTLTISLVGALHYFALRLTRDRLAAVITPALLLFSGGLGWTMFFRNDIKEGGLFASFWTLSHDYTIIPESPYRWGNALTTLLITQRSLLLGLPLSIVVFTLLWKAFNREENSKFQIPNSKEGAKKQDTEHRAKLQKTKSKKKKDKEQKHKEGADSEEQTTSDAQDEGRPFAPSPLRSFALSSPSVLIAAGVITGMLPLVHAHTFAVVIGVAGCLALFSLREWRAWVWLFVIAFVLACPQLFWVTRGATAEAKSFVGIYFGWDKGNDRFIFSEIVIFWLKNTGLFIPLLLAALCWRGKDYLVSRKWLMFYAPFALCFIGPNIVRLAPWIWDNIKVLIYWHVASLPIVALLLARLWRWNNWGRVAAIGLLFTLTFAGALDVWRVASKQVNHQEYDREAILFAEKVKRQTQPRALLLCAPTYNPIAFLTGRRLFLGYGGHVWSHGIGYLPREMEVKKIYSGSYDAMDLLQKNGIEYVVVGPQERGSVQVNDAFFDNMKVVEEVGPYRLYQVASNRIP
jgi:hypothetical protein